MLLERLRYRSLRSVMGLIGWVNSRFTPPGLLLLAGVLTSAVLGLDTNGNVAYQAFTLVSRPRLPSMEKPIRWPKCFL